MGFSEDVAYTYGKKKKINVLVQASNHNKGSYFRQLGHLKHN
jgi:hypothetical protein